MSKTLGQIELPTVGECPGSPYPDFPETMETFAERRAYQIGVAHGKAIAAAVQQKWLPIESAPDNHLPILVLSEGIATQAFRDVNWDWWPDPSIEPMCNKPTHWMTLPPAPEEEEK